VHIRHRQGKLNLPEPTFMRGPGETPGTFALESAVDEISYQLKIDPLELRLRNYSKEKNPHSGLPWSSNHLGWCFEKGAERFGWKQREPSVGTMRDGALLVGYGMATATFPGVRFGGACRLRLFPDGRLLVQTSCHEIGQGAYMAMGQMAASQLGIGIEKLKVELGDTTLPTGPIAGGSNTTATMSVAIVNAARDLKSALNKPNGTGDDLVNAVVATGKPFVESTGLSIPGPEMEKHAFHSFGAHFIEVAIDPLMPRVQVRRVVSAIDVGRIVNHKLASSQIIGGVVMGIGMALTEETHHDARTGRYVNDNLADYAVAVNADVGSIEVMFSDRPDPHFNPLGVRGVGEIGITGVAAAIANAVYHATGKRVRELPVLPHKVI
jgi:xanthine dehydrogenase YagR molybdenum-binding subunit